MTTTNIAISWQDKRYQVRALTLAKTLQLPIQAPNKPLYPFLLYLGEKGLSLQSTAISAPGPISAEFVYGKAGYQRAHLQHHPLVKALNLKSAHKPQIIDATAGLGQDAFIMASLGCQMILIERSPIIGALLKDGLQRAAMHNQTAAFVQQIKTVLIKEAKDVLTELTPEQYPDIIYLDPMFPTFKKQALPKKDRALLRQFIGPDSDAPLLCEIALTKVKKKVIVKHPLHSPYLVGTPHHSMRGIRNRYDIYMVT